MVIPWILDKLASIYLVRISTKIYLSFIVFLVEKRNYLKKINQRDNMMKMRYCLFLLATVVSIQGMIKDVVSNVKYLAIKLYHFLTFFPVGNR